MTIVAREVVSVSAMRLATSFSELSHSRAYLYGLLAMDGQQEDRGFDVTAISEVREKQDGGDLRIFQPI